MLKAIEQLFVLLAWFVAELQWLVNYSGGIFIKLSSQHSIILFSLVLDLPFSLILHSRWVNSSGSFKREVIYRLL